MKRAHPQQSNQIHSKGQQSHSQKKRKVTTPAPLSLSVDDYATLVAKTKSNSLTNIHKAKSNLVQESTTKLPHKYLSSDQSLPEPKLIKDNTALPLPSNCKNLEDKISSSNDQPSIENVKDIIENQITSFSPSTSRNSIASHTSTPPDTETASLFDHLNFLFNAAYSVVLASPILSQHYMLGTVLQNNKHRQIRELAWKSEIVLDASLLNRFCAHCYTLFLPGITLQVRAAIDKEAAQRAKKNRQIRLKQKKKKYEVMKKEQISASEKVSSIPTPPIMKDKSVEILPPTRAGQIARQKAARKAKIKARVKKWKVRKKLASTPEIKETPNQAANIHFRQVIRHCLVCNHNNSTPDASRRVAFTKPPLTDCSLSDDVRIVGIGQKSGLKRTRDEERDKGRKNAKQKKEKEEKKKTQQIVQLAAEEKSKRKQQKTAQKLLQQNKMIAPSIGTPLLSLNYLNKSSSQSSRTNTVPPTNAGNSLFFRFQQSKITTKKTQPEPPPVPSTTTSTISALSNSNSPIAPFVFTHPAAKNASNSSLSVLRSYESKKEGSRSTASSIEIPNAPPTGLYQLFQSFK